MELIQFSIEGRFAHFLKAEAYCNAMSYPIPPRTVIVGILGAILGLEKDTPQVVLEPAFISVSGKVPDTHWHRVKMRKDPPTAMPLKIIKTMKGSQKEQDPTLIRQEWLFNPSYTVWVSVPSEYQQKLCMRLKERSWHFGPSLGLSEMIADIKFIDSFDCRKLQEGEYDVESVIRRDQISVDTEAVFKEELSILLINMPEKVTEERVFSHASYLAERKGRPIPVKTCEAYSVSNKVIMFL